MRHFLPMIAAIAVLALLWIFDVPRSLGAHPQWSRDVVLLGGGIGLVLGGFSGRVPMTVRLIAFAVLAVGGFALAQYGKTAFAASYAENALAGRFWFFGWHGALAGVGALVFTIGRKIWHRSSTPG